ncbi:MAG: hypothetical protein K6E98_06955 [Lachnospiraceae bacterium]|nr:hypothetical protein [Lachnospiraceae bacterium]
MVIMEGEQKRVYDAAVAEIKNMAAGSVRAFIPYSCLNIDRTVESSILPVCFYISDFSDFALINDIVDKYNDSPVISFSVCREEHLTSEERGVFIDL